MSVVPRALCAICAIFATASAFAGDDGLPTPLPTSVLNYYIRGTQPNFLTEPIQSPDDCGGCHGGDPNNKSDWDGSLMAHSARDPLFYAALDIAEHDAPGIGDTCLRCHAPQGWLEGRAVPTDGSGLDWVDREGVSCAVCHRSVDPFHAPGSPVEDLGILASLGVHAPLPSLDHAGMPGGVGNGGMVIDPLSRIRGPFPVGNLPPGQNPPPSTNCNPLHMAFLSQPALESSLHRRSDLCATCHDVSTPHFILNPVSNQYEFAAAGAVEPTSNKYRMMPQQRTYSEWLRSEFAQAGVDMGGRFGGNGQGVIHDCMDCHMPRASGFMCDLIPVNRNDIGRHFFSGAGTWVLNAIARAFGPEGVFELNFEEVDNMAAGVLRNEKMLKCAADLDVTIEQTVPGDSQLRVRVINQTGHKLPTGFPEGRRMWLTVEFFNQCQTSGTEPVAVFGGYDPVTLTLDASTTRVYEAKLGPDMAVAAMTQTGPEPSFHAAISNQVYKDNRIPPRGFTNAAYDAIGAAPVSASYADGQFWDDTLFPIPPGATGVRVKLCYESASREYIEFLRDRNPAAGTDPENRGQFLYNLWNNDGHPPQPIVMASFPPTYSADDGMPPCTLPPQDLEQLDPDNDGIFSLAKPGDLNGDFVLNDEDAIALANLLLSETPDPALLCTADFEPDGVLNGADLQGFVDLVLGN